MRNEFWNCNVCHAQNHVTDGECQYCECEGETCKRDNCSGECVEIRMRREQAQEDAKNDRFWGQYEGKYCRDDW